MKSKRFNFFVILATVVLGYSCGKDETSKPDCSLIYCMAQETTIRLKYSNAHTGADLLFQPGSLYSIGDLKVISDRETNNAPTVEVDSTDSDNKIILFKNVGSGDALKLADLPPDIIALSKKPISNSCCSSYTVTQLQINGQSVCAPCVDLDAKVISIKK